MKQQVIQSYCAKIWTSTEYTARKYPFSEKDIAVTVPTCPTSPSNFATLVCKYKFSITTWDIRRGWHGRQPEYNLNSIFALSYLRFYIPTFANPLWRACSKDKTIRVESCCRVCILSRSLANLNNSTYQNGRSLDVHASGNLCGVPDLCEARPCWNIIKAPCVISGGSCKVFLTSMDRDSFNLVHFQKKNQNVG